LISALLEGEPQVISHASAAFIPAVCDFCHAARWYNRPDWGVAMSERDLTAREDRFLGLCLVTAAIIVVFMFILTS